jgi:hypothetical protein
MAASRNPALHVGKAWAPIDFIGAQAHPFSYALIGCSAVTYEVR